MITVKHVMQNEIYDIFEIKKGYSIEYEKFPKSMEMTEEQVKQDYINI